MDTFEEIFSISRVVMNCRHHHCYWHAVTFHHVVLVVVRCKLVQVFLQAFAGHGPKHDDWIMGKKQDHSLKMAVNLTLDHLCFNVADE